VSGVRVVRYLLANDAALTAEVPASAIAAGDAPIRTPLPAITVKHISGTPHNRVSMQEQAFQTDRVQVTILVKNPDANPDGPGYPGLIELVGLVRAACRHRRGVIDGVDVDSILPDLLGPDLFDQQVGMSSRSQDFFVKYSA
jgi:hypothetical protein